MSQLRTAPNRASAPSLVALTAALALWGCQPQQAAHRSDQAAGSRSVASRPAELNVPAGTALVVRLEQDLHSGVALTGEPVRGSLAEALFLDGRQVAAVGAPVMGEVVEAKPAKRFGGQAAVTVEWREVKLASGDRLRVEGRTTATAKKQTGKDAAIIVGSTVGGALLGDAVGGEDGDVAGAVIGGGAGTAVAAKRGDEAVLEAGRRTTVRVVGS